MESPDLPAFLERGEPARLIPVVSEGSKEQRAVSVLLATMHAVGEFGRSVLARFDAPSGRSSRIRCYTEVCLKAPEGAPKLRPDGLIVVEQGSKRWTALIEAKIGAAILESQQIEEYFEIAKEAGIDAIITISNQYSGATGGHPIALDGRKARAVALHHIPWMSLLTEAILLIEKDGVEDTERAFIAREMIRYFRHEGSGVLAFGQMGPEWKELCYSIQQGLPPTKDMPSVKAAASDWLELSRYLEMPLSLAIRHPVSVRVSREHAANPGARATSIIDMLCQDSRLSCEFDIPDAASRLTLLADLKRRVLVASMTIKAPSDRTRASSCVTWVLKQLEKCTDPDITVRAIWPRRIHDTMTRLETLRGNRDAIVPADTDALPTSFEIARTVDLGAKFRSAKAFVEAAEDIAVSMYADVGQHLRAWQPSAPKIKSKAADETSGPAIPDTVPSIVPTELPAPIPAASKAEEQVVAPIAESVSAPDEAVPPPTA